MYSILHETDPATSINFSVRGRFFPGIGKYLATAGSKYLKFYRLNPFYTDTAGALPSSSKTPPKLECMLSFTMMAPIRGMAIIRLEDCPESDSLALSFDDAKLSIVNINPATMTLNTLSLHSFEDDFLRDGYSKDTHHPELCADPKSRCCAFTVYGRHLAIVPLQKSRSDRSENLQDQRNGRQIMLQSYIVKLRSLDERLENVLDMCFMHGYYEPTLLFLVEPIQTTAGRAAVRYDTICILGVSLNLKDRVHAIVWNFSGLPMTISRCLPILQPVGGICLFGANEVIYLNQSVPARGISLNSCADEFSRFPLAEHHQQMRINLDGCACQTIPANPTDVVVVSRNGELYILTLETDRANVVRDLLLTRVFDTSIPCALTVCSSNLLFVSSHLGDSQLLRFSWEQRGKHSADDLDSAFHDEHCRILFDQDDFFLYGEEFCKSFVIQQSLTQLFRTYKFELIDSLLNVGPCKSLQASNPTYISDEFRKNPKDVYFDMITASGHGKDASLCFFHRSIRPQIVASQHLDESQRIWTIGRRRDGTHKFLVVSREWSTAVFILGNNNEMVELEDANQAFCLSEATIAAGDMADRQILVQITPTSIVLVGADQQQLEMHTVDSNFPVISASIVDPFIVLLTLNGRFFLYHLLRTKPMLQHIPALELLKHEKSPITSICLYKDLSGLFQMCSDAEDNQGEKMDVDNKMEAPLAVDRRMFARPISSIQDEQPTIKREPTEQQMEEADDIEEFLYGNSENNNNNAIGGQNQISNGHMGRVKQRENTLEDDELEGIDRIGIGDPTKIEPSYWLFFVRENGNLYIYTIPELRLVYMVRKFSQAHEVLYNDAKSALADEHQRPQHQGFMNTPVILPQPVESRSVDTAVKAEEIIVELQCSGLGPNQGRPILSALVDDMAIFYELFPFDDKISGHLAIRFRRLPCTVVVREHRFLGQNGRAPVEAVREAEDKHRPCIHPFTRIANMRHGIFVAGPYPSMLFLERGEPRLHPMTIDGQIWSFAQFNNAKCRDGFLYLTKKPEHHIRVAGLCTDINYDASYPFRKIPIGKTVHYVLFMLQPDLIALVASEKRPNKTVCTVVNEEKQVETHERDENFILPQIDAYALKLFSTEDWKFVPNVDFELEEFEAVTCCEEVLLTSESTVSGVKNYLALGTALNYGEEVYVRGRVILFELIEVVPEEGLPTTRHRLKSIYDKEQKGPVTSLCAINGFLLTGMGQKIFIWQFRDNQLHGVSFLDMHFYVHHMVAFREFALSCDLYRSISLIRYQEEFKALSLVSRDLRPTAPPPMTASFLVDHKQLGFMLTDELANITLFNYLPEMKESIGGERLIIRAALNIGSVINSIVRIKSHSSECFVDGEYQKGTHICFFATLDGSFGFVRPLNEKVFRRLHMLQQVMNMHVPQPAGLNPRGSRTARPQKTGTNQQISAAKNIVDGLLVTQYLHLSTQEKTDLSRKLGTSRYQILDDLTELSRIVTHY